MEQHSQISLTSGEVGFLWESYRCETIFLCTFQYFANVVEDQDIVKHFERGIEITETHIDKIKNLFLQEEFPTPDGFNDNDVNLKAPKLFSDETALHLINQISDTRFEVYSKHLKMTARLDLRTLCNEFLTDYNLLCHEVTETLLNKGLYVRFPHIATPRGVDYVKKKNYLTGWFGERRALEATQIAQLSLNIQRNSLLKTMLIGFIQTTENEKLKKLLETGKKNADEMIDSFHLFLKDDDIEAPILTGLAVTSSTKAPFSDKFILDFLVDITRCAIHVYGEALSMSTRRDLFTFYGKTINATTVYLHQVIDLAIELGYLEQPPIATDHEELADKNI